MERGAAPGPGPVPSPRPEPAPAGAGAPLDAAHDGGEGGDVGSDAPEPPGEFHFATVFDRTPEPLRWRRLPGLWRLGFDLALSAARRPVTVTSVLILVGAVAAAVQVGIYAELTRRLVELDSGATSAGSLLLPLVVLAGLFAARQAFSAWEANNQELMSELVSVEAQRRIIDAATSVELLEFESPTFYDQLQRAQSQASFRPMQIVSALQMIGRGIVTSVGIVAGIAVLAPILLPLVLVVYAPAAAALLLRTRQEVRFVLGMTRPERERGYVSSLLTGKHTAGELRAFELAGELSRRYEQLCRERLDELRRVKRKQARTVLAGNLGGLVLGGLVIGTLATLFELGRLPVSSAAAAVIALRQLFGFVQLAGRGGAQLHEAGTFLEDYASFIEQAEASDRRPDPPEVSPFTRLRAQGVSFRYPGSSRPALDGVSLSIEAGRVVALVGENGSGKTTFAKILAGLYRPTTGRLLVDGEEAVPGSVAVLFQDFVRYGFSAADNIGLGDTTRLDDRAAIEEAAAGAGADAMIRSLRSGYDTRLTRQFEDGADLSVGQWQRVALARALFRDAELIILDEPTAALDPKAEAELFDTVRSLAEGRTVVLISHRFSTVRNADEIVVLDHGRIVEQGSHRQLMAAGGPYAELFDLQASAYIDIDREAPS